MPTRYVIVNDDADAVRAAPPPPPQPQQPAAATTTTTTETTTTRKTSSSSPSASKKEVHVVREESQQQPTARSQNNAHHHFALPHKHTTPCHPTIVEGTLEQVSEYAARLHSDIDAVDKEILQSESDLIAHQERVGFYVPSINHHDPNSLGGGGAVRYVGKEGTLCQAVEEQTFRVDQLNRVFDDEKDQLLELKERKTDLKLRIAEKKKEFLRMVKEANDLRGSLSVASKSTVSRDLDASRRESNESKKLLRTIEQLEDRQEEQDDAVAHKELVSGHHNTLVKHTHARGVRRTESPQTRHHVSLVAPSAKTPLVFDLSTLSQQRLPPASSSSPASSKQQRTPRQQQQSSSSTYFGVGPRVLPFDSSSTSSPKRNSSSVSPSRSRVTRIVLSTPSKSGSSATPSKTVSAMTVTSSSSPSAAAGSVNNSYAARHKMQQRQSHTKTPTKK